MSADVWLAAALLPLPFLVVIGLADWWEKRR